MRRFFTKKSIAILFTAFMLFGLFGSYIYAETPTFTPTAPAGIGTPSSNPVIDSTGNPQTPTAQPATTTNTTDKKGWFAGLGEFFGKAVGGVAGLILGIVAYLLELVTIPIASIFLIISGKILNFTIQYTIYGEGFQAMTDVIKTVWILIRDTANITFIFILLYAAIKQIILGEVATKTLKNIIIAAILINFSLFITKIVIDAGNIVATALYHQIETQTTAAQGGLSDMIGGVTEGAGQAVAKLSGAGGNTLSITLSERLMNSLGLKTLYDTNNTVTPTGVEGVINAFIRLVLFLITAFVFMAMSAILVGRYVMLIFLMASSPLGFLGDSIPMLKDVSSSWKKNLQSNILIAPIFMFFMLLIIKLSTLISSQTSTDAMVIYFNYFLIIFLLIKALDITKKYSNFGKVVDQIAAGATGLALGAATGGTALLARSTIGRGATALAQSSYGKRLEEMSPKTGLTGFVARGAMNLTDKASKGTFDMRNVKIAGETLGSKAKNVGGLNLAGDYAKAGGIYGKNQTGFSGWIEKQKETEMKKAGEYEKSSKNDAQRFADQKVEELINKQAKLEKELKNETSSEKQEQIKTQISNVQREKETALNKPEEFLKEKMSSFEGAEKKISDYKKAQEELAKKEKELDEKMKTAAKEELGKIEEDRDAIKKQVKELEKEATLAEETMSLKDELTLIRDRKNMRANYAKKVRDEFLTMRTSKENAAISRNIEKGEKKKEVSNEDIDKKLEKLQEKLEEKK